MKKFSKLIWKCECGKIFESDPLEHHIMDSCPECGSGVDLETYSCRYIGNVKVIKKIPVDFHKLRLKPCWLTFGKYGRLQGRKISVSEMQVEHMKAILKTQKPSEYIEWLIKRELKLREKINNEYDIEEELKICAHEQGFSNTWDLGDGLRIYIDLVDVIKLKKLENEIYSYF